MCHLPTKIQTNLITAYPSWCEQRLLPELQTCHSDSSCQHRPFPPGKGCSKERIKKKKKWKVLHRSAEANPAAQVLHMSFPCTAWLSWKQMLSVFPQLPAVKPYSYRVQVAQLFILPGQGLWLPRRGAESVSRESETWNSWLSSCNDEMSWRKN